MSLFTPRSKKVKLSIFEISLFGMFGAFMYASKVLMEVLPNIHLIGMLTMILTIAFRKKALIPVYIFVVLCGLFGGFNLWWIPYLYIWTVLWGVTMLIPQKISKRVACVVYPVVCGLHGLLFGVLYAPAQALMFNLSFKQTVAWIATGLPYDIIHCVGNLCAGILVFPLSQLIKRINKRIM